MRRLGTLLLLLLAVSTSLAREARPIADQPIHPVPLESVRVTGGFLAEWIETVGRVTIPACLDRCEETGRIRNFAAAAGKEKGTHEGARFNDSDVYKVIEGAAWSLLLKPDPALKKRVSSIIDLIAASQQEDGYVNTYYTLAGSDQRFADVRSGHELYCAGHLIEAGIAWRRATGERKLLDVAIRFADHIDGVFGAEGRRDPPGHQEIELALLRLWQETGENRWRDLARFFLEQRGRGEGRPRYGEYAQDHLPVREQREAVGHAVRALYMYAAMADIAAATGDGDLRETLDSLWEDIVGRKMYVTGGVGSSAKNEGFSKPYDLPNDRAYAETCASIAMAQWAHRMFLLTGEGRYADVLERETFNGVLAGMSLKGDRFFYDNPLATRGDHHRVPWFSCACCPPNLARFVPSIGSRMYAIADDAVFVLLYATSEATVEVRGTEVRLRQKTTYPWSGAVAIRLEPKEPVEMELRLRLPGWCTKPVRVAVNGKEVRSAPRDGFLAIRRTWRPGDAVNISLPMEPERVRADPKVTANHGRVALRRGPIVYCLEATDHGGHARNLVLPPDATIEADLEEGLLGGVVVLRAKGVTVTDTMPVRYGIVVALKAVPYALWDNRAPGEMVVWIPETFDLAELPGRIEALGPLGLRIATSHCYRHDSLEAVADGRLPKSSGDHGIPRMTFWDRRGTAEWVEYTFPAKRRVSHAKIYWFDDTGRGACRVPHSWRLLWWDGKAWQPVELEQDAGFGTKIDAFNEVRFKPVMTGAIRLELKLRPDYSAGILEWNIGD